MHLCLKFYTLIGMKKAKISAVLGLFSILYFVILDRGILRIAANELGIYSQNSFSTFITVTSALAVIAVVLSIVLGITVLISRNLDGSDKRLAGAGIILSICGLCFYYVLPLFTISN